VRVLVTSFPGHGHFHPLAPLALALRARGDEVVVATGPDLIEWVQRCGLEAAAVGRTQDDAVREAKRVAPSGEPYAMKMFTEVAPATALDDLTRLAQRFHPDLVIHEEAEFAGPVLASQLGVPWVTHSWSAPAVPAAVRAATVQRLSPLWREHTTSPVRLHGDLYLDACPPQLQTDEALSIPGHTVVRPVPFDGPTDTGDDLDDLERPVAYLGFGTVIDFARPERLIDVATALASEVSSVLVTTGPAPVDAIDGRVPGNVRVRRYMSLRNVLPRADLVVSHGGAGTTVAALIAGCPHLALPQGAPSQGRNADAIATVGVGLALTGDAQTSDAIRSATARLIAEPDFATRAAAIAVDLATLPGPDAIADLLAARYG